MRRRAYLCMSGLLSLGVVVGGCGSSTNTSTHATTTTSVTVTTRSSTTSTAPTSTGSTTSTTMASSTSPTTSIPATASAIWPFVSGATRFHAPVTAARGFAVTYLGFVNPIVGAFRAGDARSGEVPVRASSNGPVTTVIVRKLAPDDTWFVLGASTPNLQLTTPAWYAPISSPVTLTGQSTAFEATINVQVRQDGSLKPLVADIAMGGSNGEMGPFSKSLAFPAPTAGAGAIVLKTMSAKDGNIAEATVVRVRFS